MSAGLALYMHAGSGNHGCEAIVRGFIAGLRTAAWTSEMPTVRLISSSTAEDRRYLPPECGRWTPGGTGSYPCSIEEERHIDRHFFAHAGYYVWRKLTGDRESFQRYRFPMLLGKGQPALAVSIGGDNYCYPEMVPDLLLADRMLQRRGTATALLGCSVEPEMLERDAALAEGMKRHRLILARESLTRDALLAAGVEEARLRLLPDPAFALETERLPLPEGFAEGGTVGINVSPLIENYRGGAAEGSALEAFAGLMAHVIAETDLQIALIPHVVRPTSDDRKPLAALYDRFRETRRVVLIGDAAAPALKGFIARCRFFVGARTHATIAAYSSLVPTLVVGYSVKSKGIARDLFGTDRELVLPVGELTAASLVRAFEALRDREDELKEALAAKIPETVAGSLKNGAEICALYEETARACAEPGRNG